MFGSSAIPPGRRKRFALSGITADHLAVLVAAVALGVSAWSADIAKEAQELQAEQIRRAQADQVLLFADDPRREPSEVPPDDDPKHWEYIYVRNYSRLPLPRANLLVEWRAHDDSRVVFRYRLGPLGPCKQYPIKQVAADAIERGRNKLPEVREFDLFMFVDFVDASGQNWGRQFGKSAVPSDEFRVDQNFTTRSVETVTLPGPMAAAEPVPDCSPT